MLDWPGTVETLTSCGALGAITAFLVFMLRRETTEKRYWRDKVFGLLDLGEQTVAVAADIAKEPR